MPQIVTFNSKLLFSTYFLKTDNMVSIHEKNFIIDGVQEGVRNDGRSVSDYRPVSLETGVLNGSNGSARVLIGSTDVLVAVKAELCAVERVADLASAHRLRFFVDISANAAPKFAGRGGNELAEHWAATLRAAFDNEAALPDLCKLVLAPTQLWCLFVDVLVLQYDGNAMDAISLGVKAALGVTDICTVVLRPADEGKVHIELPDEISTWRMDVERAPLVIGVNKIGAKCVLDADLMEEICSSSTLYIGVQPTTKREEEATSREDCVITCMKKVGGGSLEIQSMDEMIGMAIEAAVALNGAFRRRMDKLAKSKQNATQETGQSRIKITF